MQFKVPQFIDIEDKAIGPLTWPQLAWCVGALGSLYLGFRFTDSKILGLLVGGAPAALFLCLSFVKVNNRPFLEFAQNAIIYFLNNNLYIWQNKQSKTNTVNDTLIKIEQRKAKEREEIERKKNEKHIDIAGLAKRLDK